MSTSAGSPAAPDGTRFAGALLLALAGWQLLFWVVAPVLAYSMLPADTLELLGWGQEWQLGYYKHPPLGAWLGEAWLQAWGGWLGSQYLLAQLCVLATLAYVWRTGLLVTDPARAALGAALLAGSYFHTLLSPNFNMNLLQLPLWAGFAFHLLAALRGGARHWLAVGAFAALCLLAKYSGLLLLASAGLALLADPRGRAALQTRWPWLGLALCLALLAPHLAWLWDNWQLPLAYLRGFDAPASGWQWHMIEPVRFAVGALGSLLLAGVLLLPLLALPGRMAPSVLWERVLRATGAAPVAPKTCSHGTGVAPVARKTRSHSAVVGVAEAVEGNGAAARRLGRDAWVLMLLTAGPLLLSMAYGMATGSRLKTTWAAPFFNHAGLLALLLLPTQVDLARLRRFAVLLAVVVLLTCGGHLAYKLGSSRSKTAFDGPALAARVADAWSARFDAPLRIVAADHVLAAIVSGYAPGRPSMLVAGDFARSPWLAPADLERHGAAVLCEADGQACLPALPPGVDPQDIEVDGRHFTLRFLPPM